MCKKQNSDDKQAIERCILKCEQQAEIENLPLDFDGGDL